MYNNNQILKRKKKIRIKITNSNKYRLTVYKSNKHIYAQLYTPDGNKVIASNSTLDKNFKNILKNKLERITKTEAAKIIGILIAEKLEEKNIKNIAFDRSGFKFHGRIKAIADSIKEKGIKC